MKAADQYFTEYLKDFVAPKINKLHDKLTNELQLIIDPLFQLHNAASRFAFERARCFACVNPDEN